MDPRPSRNEPLMPNVGFVARREYAALVRGRLFFVSTLVLAGLAMFVAILPVAAKLIDRGSVTTVAVVVDRSGAVAPDPRHARRASLNSSGSEFDLIAASDEQTRSPQVADRELDAAVIADRGRRRPARVQLPPRRDDGPAADRRRSRWACSASRSSTTRRTTRCRASSSRRSTSSGPSAAVGGERPFDASAFASRLIVGAVFGVLIFITIVIYGMWVAAGRRRGEVEPGHGAAGQRGVDAAARDRQGAGHRAGRGDPDDDRPRPGAPRARRGGARSPGSCWARASGFAASVSSLSPALLLAFAVFYVLGFALYSLVYAAAGSLVSRPEDLQIIALPLSIVAIAGYGMGAAGPDRRDHRVHPARVVRPVLEPVRDADPAVGRAGGAVGARAVRRRCSSRRSASWASSRSGSTGRACCSTASGRGCARTWRPRAVGQRRLALSKSTRSSAMTFLASPRPAERSIPTVATR